MTPSPSVLDALARVFDLDSAQRAHLYHLAGVALPLAAGPYPTQAPEELDRVVTGLAPNPAYLLGPRADVLAWNSAATAVLGAPGRAPDGTTNLLWWMFTSAATHNRGWTDTARFTLARFRAEHARRYGDPAFDALIRALLKASPRFAELWRRHEVLDAQVGTKVIEHPRLGRLTVHHLQSIPTSHPELRLTQFVPADAATREALAGAGDATEPRSPTEEPSAPNRA